MKLPLSTYYAKPKISRALREATDAALRDEIEKIRTTFSRAGYRPLRGYLRQAGIVIGERKLRRILAKFALQIRPRRRFVRTTNSEHPHPVYEKLLEDHEPDGINQAWVSDITYIRIANGFVFLAVILDLYSRKVIGWAISKRIDGELALAALAMAIQRRNPSKGVIHHSDRGVQYLCEDYVALLTKHHFRISCSRKGNPYDNAFAESFMKTLKQEEVYLWAYETYLDVIERVPYFIEEVYNTKRLHSSLDYVSPEEFERNITTEHHNGGSRPTPTPEAHRL